MPSENNIHSVLSGQEKRLKNLETKRARVSVDAVIGAGSTSGSSGVAAAFWVDVDTPISIYDNTPNFYYTTYPLVPSLHSLTVSGGSYATGRVFYPFVGVWNIKHDLNRTVMLTQLIDISSAKPYNSMGLQAKNIDANNYQLLWNGGFTSTTGDDIVINRSTGNIATLTGGGVFQLYDKQLVYIDVESPVSQFPGSFVISRPNPGGAVTVETSLSGVITNLNAKIYATTPYGYAYNNRLRAILVG
jgi:hypothetical protein